MKDNKYAGKYALIYTSLVAAILLTPLFFYFIYMKNIHSIQNELILKEQSLLIIKSMEEYNQNEEYFEYPRFKTFNSGLYNKGFEPIFTLIDYKIKYFKEGYHLDGNNAYVIIRLPKERYFDAQYLIVQNNISYAVVYEKVFIILASVVFLVLLLSIYFLNRFARPFKKLNKTLDNFIKDSMHEINTPLSIISVNIDLYNRKNEPNKYLNRMKAATKVLSNIYNDMDYLVKYDRVDYEDEVIDMKLFLNDRIEYFTEVANMKDITIESNIQEGVEVLMNPKQLQRVVDNNISNAIKYSYENTTIEIEFTKIDNKVVLSFKDYGVGIEKVSKIFTRYYREDNSKGGFGIGLNIVKTIIDTYNIKLQIDSKLAHGSTFSYTFPTRIVQKKA